MVREKCNVGLKYARPDESRQLNGVSEKTILAFGHTYDPDARLSNHPGTLSVSLKSTDRISGFRYQGTGCIVVLVLPVAIRPLVLQAEADPLVIVHFVLVCRLPMPWYGIKDGMEESETGRRRAG